MDLCLLISCLFSLENGIFMTHCIPLSFPLGHTSRAHIVSHGTTLTSKWTAPHSNCQRRLERLTKPVFICNHAEMPWESKKKIAWEQEGEKCILSPMEIAPLTFGKSFGGWGSFPQLLLLFALVYPSWIFLNAHMTPEKHIFWRWIALTILRSTEGCTLCLTQQQILMMTV